MFGCVAAAQHVVGALLRFCVVDEVRYGGIDGCCLPVISRRVATQYGGSKLPQDVSG